MQLYRPCPGRTQDKPKKESSSVLKRGNPALPATRGFLLFWEQWKSASLSYNTKRSALRLYYFHLFSFVSANSTSENGESPLKPIYWLQREPVFLMHLFCWGFFFGFVCLFLSFHLVFRGTSSKNPYENCSKAKKCSGHHLKERNHNSLVITVILNLLWVEECHFLTTTFPSIKTALSYYIAQKHLHCIKGFVLLFFSYHPNSKKKLSSRQGKGVTSELGGSHHFRSRHEKN